MEHENTTHKWGAGAGAIFGTRCKNETEICLPNEEAVETYNILVGFIGLPISVYKRAIDWGLGAYKILTPSSSGES